MQYIIVGAGPAGVVAAETLRTKDPKGEVTLIGDEPEPVYSRMAIPYLLANRIGEEGTHLRHDPGHSKRLGIHRVQDRVTAVDSQLRRLDLAGGEELTFDRLLLASGSTPIKPPIEGLDRPGVHHCWTLEDARRIMEYAQPGARVVLLGAGFIGSIIIEALIRREVRLTVVEMADRMVPRMMDQTAGGLIGRWCQENGVNLRTSSRITGVGSGASGGARFLLECEPGEAIPADLIVVATGVRPAVGYLSGSGITVDTGVVVDEYLQTSVPDIYAAGDICEGLEWNGHHHAVHAIQPVAVETGRMAALNMSGDRGRYIGSMAMNVLDTLGLISTSYGDWQGVPDGEDAKLLDEAGFRYIRLQFLEDRLVGAITLGLTQHVGVLRGLIQSRVRLQGWKQRLMEDPSRIMEAYLGAAGIR